MDKTDFEQYLSILNEQQREAVVHEGKSLLILSGAGSGKTRVITTKIAYLINQKDVNPYSILSVTFTKKAANEMKERAIAIEPKSEDSQIRTFHSFGSWFLRKYSEYAGVESSFTVYDDEDMATLVKKAVPSLSSKEAHTAARQISLAKDYCLFPEDDLTFIGSEFDLNDIYAKYQNRLHDTGNVDFGDLILLPVKILQDEPSIATYIHNRFSVIMVDEYQDSNIAQYKLLQVLSGVNEGNSYYVCVVGDDDQSIYHFRGAEVQNILTFPERFPGTDIIRLEKNYRSTARILKAASLVVQNNKDRMQKNIIADREDGKTPVLAFLDGKIVDKETGRISYNGSKQEAMFCSTLIRKSVESGGTYSDWAILYRTNAQSRSFETELSNNHIPYKLIGSLKFYEREEIKDILAYLSLFANNRDEISFRRIVNKPSRGLGEKTQDRIRNYSAQNNCNLLDAMNELSPELPKKAREATECFCKIYSDLKKYFSNARNNQLSDFIARFIKDTGLDEYHKASDEIEGTQRLDNLQEIVNSAVVYECSMVGLLAFLDTINLERSLDIGNDSGTAINTDNFVTLITLHNTKGLEYNKVIITGLEEEVFPRKGKDGADLEEERRLFYVGITRAKNELYVTSAANRNMYGSLQFLEPSRFLIEAASAFKIVGNKPLSFGTSGSRTRSFFEPNSYSTGGYGTSGYGKYSSVAANYGNKSYLAEKWTKGTKVFHDDYGYGVIQSARFVDEEYKIEVRFSGGTKTFLPEYQSKSLLIIKD